MDIENNAGSPLFINFKINLIFSLYPEKCIKFNQSEGRLEPEQPIRSREILKLGGAVIGLNKVRLSKKKIFRISDWDNYRDFQF